VFEQFLGSNGHLADALCMDWSIKKEPVPTPKLSLLL